MSKGKKNIACGITVETFCWGRGLLWATRLDKSRKKMGVNCETKQGQVSFLTRRQDIMHPTCYSSEAICLILIFKKLRYIHKTRAVYFLHSKVFGPLAIDIRLSVGELLYI